ncbi:MAG: FixH family protein [Owenweeksia sp.]|nr:FixH family protein [Owenweeksia sp.]
MFQAGTDSKVEDAEVMFMPIMDMGAMMHTTPVENPDWDADMDAYMGAATFIMPSTAGDWLFNLIANQPGEVADTISFPISVEAKTEARLYSFVSADDSSTSYFVALKEPMQPKVGLNDFEVMIYRRESMMSFPDATDFQVEIEPTMPSMGHGSPDNINPVHVANGLYAGKVNFTMSGHWKVAVTLRNSTWCPPR